MDINIRHPRFYAIYFINIHIFQKNYCKVSKRILIIFAPEEAEIFKDYLFLLAWFSVRLPLVFLWFKDNFCFLTWNLLYILTKSKIGKFNICVYITRKQKPYRQKLLSDKQIKFKEFCVFWNKVPKKSEIFFWKNVVLYEIYSKKAKVRNTYVFGL
jgi:hypothetical protein